MVLTVTVYQCVPREAMLALPASVVWLLDSPWGRCRYREVSPRGWREWFALAFRLTLAA